MREKITKAGVAKYLLRCLVSVIGLFLLAIGVNFSVKAGLGTSPTSCIPYVASKLLPFSMGRMTMALNFLFILIQIVLMRKKTDIESCIYQVLVALVFGSFVDVTASMMGWISEPGHYVIKWVYMVISILLIAVGTFLGVKSNLIMPSGEALTLVLSRTLKIEFGKIKIFVDAAQVVVAVVFSLIFLHSLSGVREGTVAAVLFVGIVVKWLSAHIKFFDTYFARESTVEEATAEENAGGNGIVITIGREFGSGGRAIGMAVAEKLGYRFVDREILALAVMESGLDEKYVEKYEENNSGKRRFELYESAFSYVDGEIPKQRQLYNAQSKVIKKLAKDGNVVIVGRLANFILKNSDNVLDVFVSADKEFRINRVMTEGCHDRQYAEQKIAKKDVERANHCKFCTGHEWGRAEDYSLTVRSSKIGIDASVEAICRFASAMEAQRKETLAG